MKKEIKTDKAPKPIGPYSQGIETENFVFLSGQIGIDPSSGELKEGIEEQTHQIMKNIKHILEKVNLGMENIVRVDVFLKNMEHFQKFNEVYAQYLSSPYPIRSTVEVSKLPKDALVEITVIATK